MHNVHEIIKEYYPVLKGIHPAADSMPPISEEEFTGLADDIGLNGLRDPLLVTEDGLLVDGRSRLLACYEMSAEITVDVVKGDPWDIAFSRGLRRNLTIAQKALVAQKRFEHEQKRAKERQAHGQTAPGRNASGNVTLSDGRARDQVAKSFGIGGSSVDKGRFIKESAPDLADILWERGKLNGEDSELTLEMAYGIAKFRAKGKPEPEKHKLTQARSEVISFDGEIAEVWLPKKVVFNKTNENVDWASHTWNPVTGCNHGCSFCYAREIAEMDRMEPYYPLGFTPVLHEYRLAAPKNTKLDGNGQVFVCSMADLFGKWVPNDWIMKVFAACLESPDWTYMFLTKWPKRYKMISTLPHGWFGASVIKQADVARIERDMNGFETDGVKWISLEPMLGPIKFKDLSWCDLVVIGSQTAANGEPDIAPEFDWVVDVVNQCREFGIKYYLKPNMMEIKPGMKMPRNLPTNNKETT